MDGYWSDLWIVVAPDPFPRYSGTSDPAWLASAGQVGGGAGGGIGHNVPRVYVDGVLADRRHVEGRSRLGAVDHMGR